MRWALAQSLVLSLAVSSLLMVASSGASTPAALSDTQQQQQQPQQLLLWLAPHYSGGGYSTEAYAYCSALDDLAARDRRSWRVAIAQHGDSYSRKFVMGLDQTTTSKMLEMAARAPEHDADLTGSVTVCHSEPGAWAVASGPLYSTTPCPYARSGLRVGRTMFETDRLPSGWAERLNAMDEVWVPTAFHRDIFAAGGVDPSRLAVVPESVDVRFFNPARHKPLTLEGPAGDYKFISVFKWEHRKGWMTLLEAFARAFTRDSPVALYLVTRPFPGAPNVQEAIADFLTERQVTQPRTMPRVYILSELSANELARAYRAADAFVLPSHGEGWGRPHCEAMAMGLPVIATNWSGPTEYLNDRNGYPLPIDGLVPVARGAFASHYWAQPSVVKLTEIMRHIVMARDEARAKGVLARQTMVDRFSNEVVAHALVARVDALMARARERAALAQAQLEDTKSEL